MTPHEPASEVTMNRSTPLPAGVSLVSLTTHADSRGDLTEIFRNEWHHSPLPAQWLITRSGANTLRGVHVHALNWDYLCVIEGETIVGLHDMRPEAADPRSTLIQLSGARIQMLVIPPGVAHGFYSPVGATHVIGASKYFDSADHRGCRWDSPELGLDWPCTAPMLSEKDRAVGSYAELRAAYLRSSAHA
jgi:dTDP-4-dehydrorhamnose 3,5-epimerase